MKSFSDGDFIKDCNFDIFEVLLSIASLKDRATGKDAFKALKKMMDFKNLLIEKLAGVTTGGALCMIGKGTGLAAFLKKQNGVNRNVFTNYHCIIRRENLSAKTQRLMPL